jgi:hypothetical protein
MRGGDATLPNCNAICTQSTVLLTATAIEHANSTSRSLPDSSSEEGECGRCPADEIVEEGVVRLLCSALWHFLRQTGRESPEKITVYLQDNVGDPGSLLFHSLISYPPYPPYPSPFIFGRPLRRGRKDPRSWLCDHSDLSEISLPSILRSPLTAIALKGPG